MRVSFKPEPRLANRDRGAAVRLWRWAGVTVIASLVGACNGVVRESDARQLEYSVQRPNTGRVPGLREALGDGPGPVRVLVVHGMRVNQPDYSEHLRDGIARRLDLEENARATVTMTLHRGYVAAVSTDVAEYEVDLAPSTMRIITLEDEQKTPRVIVYELLWAPMRDEIKDRFLGCFEARPARPRECVPSTNAHPNTDSRSLINGILKDDIMINGVADAMIVTSPVGDVLRDDLYLANCIIANDVLRAASSPSAARRASDERCSFENGEGVVETDQAAVINELQATPYFVITQSLGSYLVLDAQREFLAQRAGPEGVGFHLLDNATIYMLANQVSLLNLARLNAVCRPEPGEDCPNQLLRNETTLPRNQLLSNTVVAFNDVDDLLGYELPPSVADMEVFGRMINVSVRNPGGRVWPILQWPESAHTGHDRNPAVIHAIVEGFRYPAIR